MIGAIIGDIVGSRFEFNNTDNKDFEFFTDECRYTDDTVMSVAIAKALLVTKDIELLYKNAEKCMRELGRKHPKAGYGGMFRQWLSDDRMGPYNSYGNGSAMRISAVGNYADTIADAKELAYWVTAPTHNHYEGIKGAECIAVCMVLAKQGKSKGEIRKYVIDNYDYQVDLTVDEWRKVIGGWHGYETCQVSVPEALCCFFESTDYEDCIRNCISIGGDSDTLCAIAGAIAECYYGVPEEFANKMYDYLPDDLADIVRKFGELYE